MRSLRRHTILGPLPCDLKRLPLSSVEGFLLTLIDGQSTIGDIAEIHGMTLAQIFPHADRLLEVGAVGVVGEKGAAREAPRKSVPPRQDPKAQASARPTKSPPPRSTPPTRATPSTRTTPSTRPTARPTPPTRATPTARATPSTRPTARATPTRRTSHTGRPSQRPPERRATPAAPPRDKATEATPALDEVVLARILGFDARLPTIDHYAVLGVARGTEKMAIKRAYFALAAEFHPDRHFGKELGKAGPALQRIFTRLTEAYDTLANRARSAAYDASLPPVAVAETPVAPVVETPVAPVVETPVAPTQPAPAPFSPPPASLRRTPSRPLATQRTPAMRSTRKMRAVEGPAPAPASPPPRRAPSAGPPPRADESVAQPTPPPGTPRRSPQAEEAMRRLHAGAKHEEVRRRAGVFIDAAEDAMRRDDVVTAASHYRLALQNTDDPAIRAKLGAIEEASEERIHKRSLARARSAERDERWADAAIYFMQANGVRPEAATAERAAHALRMSDGDLRRAVHLAEQAVLAEPNNAAYRVTLGQVCLAANLVKRALGEAERALAIDPNHTNAKALAEAAAKRR